MSGNAPKKLTIEHLRGSVQPFNLLFEKGKKLTIVYGENAAGKSTICDAFDFIGKGSVGSLENRGLGKTNRYWPSIGKNPGDVSVTLETTNTMCRATIVKGDVVFIPQEHRPRVEVLRRSKILSLVEAKPADRYSAIRQFIDVAGIEASEAALRDLIRGIESSREVAVARVQENQDTINKFWEAAGKPSADPLKWAYGEVKRDTTVLDVQVKDLDSLQKAYARLVDCPGQIAAAEQNLRNAEDSLAAAQAELDKRISNVSDSASEVIEILEAAKKHFVKHPTPAVCPLCESSEKADGLAERVNQRLDSVKALDQLRHAQTTKIAREQDVQRAMQRIEIIQESYRRYAVEFEAYQSKGDWPSDVKLIKTPIPSDLKAWEKWLSDTAHFPIEWKSQEQERLDKKQFLNTLKSAFETLNQNTLTQKELDVLIPKLKETLKLVEEERRHFIDVTLSAIATEVGRLYEMVHPGEGLNKISFEIDPNKRASIDIAAHFEGISGAPPQAYFSDSHLDTLGLCIFLALSAMDLQEETILVLDDILASIDEPHVERLIEMIYQEALKFRHCIITTHYRPWKQKLRWGWLQNGQCHFVELAKWTAGNGLTLIRSIPDVEKLGQLLAETPPDPQLVAGKAGVILEAALDFLTQLYECAVPRRSGGHYTLGDLLPAIDKKLRQSLTVEKLTGKDSTGKPQYTIIPLAPYFEELTRIAHVRNVFGCHFNELSFELLESDALGFGEQVLNLMEVLIDADTGWPRNDKSGSYWATTGETRRLHPLKKPS